jgi:hypothetical protein
MVVELKELYHKEKNNYHQGRDKLLQSIELQELPHIIARKT